jgi:hypothetical protein
MNRKTWTANPLLAGWLLLVLSVPCAFAADPPQAADGDKKGPEMSPEATNLGDLDHLEAPPGGWFSPETTRYDGPYVAQEQLDIYGKKQMVEPMFFPPIRLGRRLYDRGAYAPRPTWLGAKNPIGFSFMSYGDLRVAAASYDNGVPINGKTEQSVVAARLNLDMDLALTATERIHAFVRPLDKNGSFTRYQISGGAKDEEFVDEFDFALDTLFFEGDLGAMSQGWTNRTNSLDLPIALGRVPLFTQNGIWLDDAFTGLAVGITAKNNPSLDISNMDLTFFAGFNQVTTAAVPDSNDKSKVFGLAGFADALKGYVELGYGYIDADVSDLSYHNLTAAFTKRYRGRVANSVRVIGNFGQKGIPGQPKTADGVLLLVENSILPRYTPWGDRLTVLNFVPYVNLFVGFDTPQPLARAADSGGVLKNTGINFESDGLTGYPTLDASGHDSYGGAFGLEYLFNLDRQIVVEGAVVERRGNSALGSQYALGARYQHPITHAWIVRLDAMRGWRQGQKDVYGARLEIRRKL